MGERNRHRRKRAAECGGRATSPGRRAPIADFVLTESDRAFTVDSVLLPPGVAALQDISPHRTSHRPDPCYSLPRAQRTLRVRPNRSRRLARRGGNMQTV